MAAMAPQSTSSNTTRLSSVSSCGIETRTELRQLRKRDAETRVALAPAHDEPESTQRWTISNPLCGRRRWAACSPRTGDAAHRTNCMGTHALSHLAGGADAGFMQLCAGSVSKQAMSKCSAHLAGGADGLLGVHVLLHSARQRRRLLIVPLPYLARRALQREYETTGVRFRAGHRASD